MSFTMAHSHATVATSGSLLKKAVVLILASEIPLSVMARRCWTDVNGFVRCSSSFSTGARIGTGLGISFFFILLFCVIAMSLTRRRRMHRLNRSFQPQPPFGQQAAYGNPSFAGNAAGPQQAFGPSPPQVPVAPPPPGYNEPQVPENTLQGSKV